MLQEGFSLANIAVAFSAGFLNFLLPCIIAVVPVQIAVLALPAEASAKAGVFGARKGPSTGSTTLTTSPLRTRRFTAFWRALPFVLGFLGVFILLGLTVNSLARVLAPWRGEIQTVGGIVLVVWGLSMLGILRLPIFYSTSVGRWPALKILNSQFSTLNSKGFFALFLLGVLLAFAWTPCIGPTLALILFWASQASTFGQGAFLMLIFGLGMAVPFLVLSLVLDFATPYLGFLKRAGRVFEVFSAVLIIVLGLLLASGRFGILIGWVLRFIS